jgi:protoporphyrinogen oxidase
MDPRNTENPPSIDPAIAALIPTGNDIYNAIMAQIEPELLSENLASLEQKYTGESSEERAARMERYKYAFVQYDEAYSAWMHNVQVAVQAKRADALHKAEVKVGAKDQAVLSRLEEEFLSSAV